MKKTKKTKGKKVPKIPADVAADIENIRPDLRFKLVQGIQHLHHHGIVGRAPLILSHSLNYKELKIRGEEEAESLGFTDRLAGPAEQLKDFWRVFCKVHGLKVPASGKNKKRSPRKK